MMEQSDVAQRLLTSSNVADPDDAIMAIAEDELATLLISSLIDPGKPAVVGRPLSPGAASGALAFTADEVLKLRQMNPAAPIILAKRQTTPDDVPAMEVCGGIIAFEGGETSHAAIIARQLGIPAVRASQLRLVTGREAVLELGTGSVLNAGQPIAFDSHTGEIFARSCTVQPAAIAGYAAGNPPCNDLERAVDRLLLLADARSALAVYANADDAEQAAKARRLGAKGIGVVRTEHMFMGERNRLFQEFVVSESSSEAAAALRLLEMAQQQDFYRIFREMDGLPVTVRLADPPLHEFFDPGALAARDDPLARKITRWLQTHQEQNPMMGLRGVRLLLQRPELLVMQVRAIARATVALRAAGRDPRPEIMVPFIADAAEFDEAARLIEQTLAEFNLSLPYGAMAEIPRFAEAAGEVAAQPRAAAFLSFGTNDLTQFVWGFSRDDLDEAYWAAFRARHATESTPFETIDEQGVGACIARTVQAARATNPQIKLGVCGEHGGDPRSIRFFAGHVDYVSCAPRRLLVARLAAGRAAVLQSRQRATQRVWAHPVRPDGRRSRGSVPHPVRWRG